MPSCDKYKISYKFYNAAISIFDLIAHDNFAVQHMNYTLTKFFNKFAHSRVDEDEWSFISHK